MKLLSKNNLIILGTLLLAVSSGVDSHNIQSYQKAILSLQEANAKCSLFYEVTDYRNERMVLTFDLTYEEYKEQHPNATLGEFLNTSSELSSAIAREANQSGASLVSDCKTYREVAAFHANRTIPDLFSVFLFVFGILFLAFAIFRQE